MNTYCLTTSEMLHPYECDGRGKCRHCDRAKTPDHDPDICAFCSDDAGLDQDPDTEETL